MEESNLLRPVMGTSENRHVEHLNMTKITRKHASSLTHANRDPKGNFHSSALNEPKSRETPHFLVRLLYLNLQLINNT